ncbi:hypothetical protein Tco_1412994, partial [Tanacetum coccineum]
MVINSPCLTDKKELAIPGQMTTGKELSNLLMADSLPKCRNPIITSLHYQLHGMIKKINMEDMKN